MNICFNQCVAVEMYLDLIFMAYQGDHPAFFQKINGLAHEQGLLALNFFKNLLGSEGFVIGYENDAIGTKGVQGKGVYLDRMVLNGFTLDCFFQIFMQFVVFQHKNAKGI